VGVKWFNDPEALTNFTEVHPTAPDSKPTCTLNRLRSQALWTKPFVVLRHLPSEATWRGLPKWVKTVNAKNIDSMRDELRAGRASFPPAPSPAPSPAQAEPEPPDSRPSGDEATAEASSSSLGGPRARQEHDDDEDFRRFYRVVGIDTGWVWPVVAASNDVNGTARDMKLSAKERQETTASTQRAKDGLYQRFGIKLRQAALDGHENARASTLHRLASVVHHRSRRYLESSWRLRQRVESLNDRVAHQFFTVFDAKPHSAGKPLLVAIGDGWGAGSEFKRKTPDFANGFLRHIMRVAAGRKLDITWVRVSESYSSICCPDPQCRRPPFDQEGHEVRGAPQGTWIRSRMHNGFHKDNIDAECQRTLQCESCRQPFHRDVVGAFNIAYILWHLFKWGRHPWSTPRA